MDHGKVLLMVVWVFLLGLLERSLAFKVSYELDDRFIEFRKDAKWLVMFYAPWCHHCHQAEPVWEQVAQTFNQQQASLGLRIGKIDATKQTRSASEFKVKGFPTIKFIHGDRIVTYDGERSREEIEDFANKAVGPAVRKLSALSDLRNVETKHDVFFVFIAGPTLTADVQSRADYATAAEELMTSTYFFELDHRVALGVVPFDRTPAIAVYKDKKYVPYDGKTDLKEWIIVEKMPTYPKITGGNYYQFLEVKKLMAMAVVQLPLHREVMSHQTSAIFNSLKTVSMERERNHLNYSFGYMDGNEIINQVVAEWIAPPALVVYDPVKELYYIFPETTELTTPGDIQMFLDGILVGKIKGCGGKGWFRKAYKFCYSIAAYFYKMFSTQPILASILFGLPLGILCIIIVMTYTNDCTDTSNPEDDDSDHEKEE